MSRVLQVVFPHAFLVDAIVFHLLLSTTVLNNTIIAVIF